MIPVWSTACPDWAERLKKGLSIIPDPIYPDEAAHALAIFKQLRIVDAPGSPTFGESCAPWVFDLVAALFGSYDAQTGVRHIKEVFILIPKKNSKSTLAAGIMMTALLLNWRQAAGYTILAPTVEVAANAFNPARDMVRRDDDLDDLCQVQTHIRTITHRVTDTTLKVVAADPNTVSGIKSVGTLIDELWLFGKQCKAEDMLREAIGGLASRPEGFVVYTTTQSNEPPAGVFRQKLQYARDVRDGKIHDPHFLPVIFEHPPEMVESGANLLMENLAMVNPNLGYSVDEPFLYREYRKAREAGEETFRGFMSKHANVEIGLALRSDRWAGADFWEEQGRCISLDDILRRADVVTVGIDGGGLDDLLGMYVIGRDRETREWLGWGHAWAHETAVVRRKSEASRFQDLVACGDMTIVRRVGDDTAEVAEYVRRIHEAELLDHIGIDPSGVGQILDSLAEAGIPDGIVVGISQGWKLGGAIKTTERKLAEGVLVHGDQPLMAWCVGNARVEPKGNAILITKQASGRGKIDPLMALFNAVSLMSLNWVDNASDYASQAAQLATEGISGMVNNITEMLNGNKVEWRNWASSVLQEISKVLMNAAIVNGIKTAANGMSGAGGFIGSIGDWLGGAVANAKGGVYTSANLSAYSNSIVDTPTYFAFAKGAGLMGEAGPEAIMSLTRAADGSLGVRAVGSMNGSAGLVYSPVYHIAIQNDGANGQIGAEAAGSLVQLIDQRVQAVMLSMRRDGGMLSG
ncbi:phage tail tape measure protein [Escherichia coli]